MANPALLRSLLGAFIGQQAPELNPNYTGLDENGNPINNQARYNVGGLGTRLFHPDVYQFETEQNQAPQLARYRDLISSQVGDVGTKEAMAGYGYDPREMSTRSLTRFTGGQPARIPLVSEQMADIAAGNPIASALNRANALESSSRGLVAGMTAGIPEKQALSEKARLQYTEPLWRQELENLPGRGAIERAQTQAGLSLIPSTTEATREEALARSEEAQVRSGLAKEELSNLPAEEAIQAGMRRLRQYDVLHPQIPPSPFYRSTVTGRPILSPAWPGMMNMMNAKMMGGQGNGFIPVSDTLNIGPSLAPTQSNPSRVNPSSNPNTIARSPISEMEMLQWLSRLGQTQ